MLPPALRPYVSLCGVVLISGRRESKGPFFVAEQDTPQLLVCEKSTRGNLIVHVRSCGFVRRRESVARYQTKHAKRLRSTQQPGLTDQFTTWYGTLMRTSQELYSIEIYLGGGTFVLSNFIPVCTKKRKVNRPFLYMYAKERERGRGREGERWCRKFLADSQLFVLRSRGNTYVLRPRTHAHGTCSRGSTRVVEIDAAEAARFFCTSFQPLTLCRSILLFFHDCLFGGGIFRAPPTFSVQRRPRLLHFPKRKVFVERDVTASSVQGYVAGLQHVPPAEMQNSIPVQLAIELRWLRYAKQLVCVTHHTPRQEATYTFEPPPPPRRTR